MPAEFDANQNLSLPQATAPAISSPSHNDDELMWDLLSLYADGEASQEEAAQVEQMLRHDAAYARAYTFLQSAGGAIRTIVEIEPPAHLRSAILAKTTRKPTLARRASIVFGAFRTQLAAPVGRLAFAGSGLAAAALVIGLYAGRTTGGNSSNGITPSIENRDENTKSTIAKTNSPAIQRVKPTVTSPDVTATVPVYVLPRPSGIVKASIPLPKDAAKPNSPTNPVAMAKPNPLPAPAALPAGPRLAQTEPSVRLTPTVKPSKHLSAPILPQKGNGPVLARNETAPLRHTDLRVTEDSSTQNVNPMMDANVQHRTAPMVIASISSAGGSLSSTGSRGMGADMDDLNDNHVLIVHDVTAGGATGMADGDSAATGGRKIVGRLMLSKLPPSSRHLLSPADAIREANSRSLVNYSAASPEETPRRAADVPVLKGSF